MEKQGDFTPKYIGHDSNEIVLSYVKGEAIHEELSVLSYQNKVEMIKSSAGLLRKLHDLSEQFDVVENDAFFLSYEGSLEKTVICHNDYAPYNVTFDGYEAVGIIDFDTICPAPREWDIAYGIYRFILIDPTLADEYNPLMTTFLEYYGYQKSTNFDPIVIDRIESLVNLFDTEIEKENPAFIKMSKDGHREFYI